MFKLDIKLGESSIDWTLVIRWFEKFKRGNENLENEPRARPKSISNNDKLEGKVEANPRANNIHSNGIWMALEDQKLLETVRVNFWTEL